MTTSTSELRSCLWCGYDLRYSTSYDEPHWVHVASRATIECPGYGIGQAPTPAVCGCGPGHPANGTWCYICERPAQ